MLLLPTAARTRWFPWQHQHRMYQLYWKHLVFPGATEAFSAASSLLQLFELYWGVRNLPISGGLGFLTWNRDVYKILQKNYKCPNRIKLNCIINPIIWGQRIFQLCYFCTEVHTGQTDPSLGPICSSLTPFPSVGKDETISVSALCTKLPGLYLPCILLISLLGYTDYFSSSHWPCGTFIQPLTLVLISSGWAHRGWKNTPENLALSLSEEDGNAT